MNDGTASGTGARRFGLVLLLTGVAATAVGGGMIARARLAPNEGSLVPPGAEALHSQIEQALRTNGQLLEAKARAAAHVPELLSGIDIGADAETFEDLLQTEDWWAPYRGSATVSGLVSAQSPIAVLGPALHDLENLRVLRDARQEGSGWGLAAGRESAVLLGAARVPGKRAAGGMVVFLGTLIDRATLQAAMQPTAPTSGHTPAELPADGSVAIALADAKRVLVVAGHDASPAMFMDVVGKELQGPIAAGMGQAMAWPLDDKVTLLALFASTAPRLGSPEAPLALTFGGVALLLLGLVLRLTRRGADPLPTTAPTMMAATPMEGASSVGPTGAGWPDHGEPDLGRARAPVVRVRPENAMAAMATLDAATATDPAAVLPVRLGRYQLIERIGEGGMAEIYIAAAHGAEGFVRRFVIKRMHPHLSKHREAVNQFIDEARLQSGLVHSNIVPVYDFGKVGDNEYFIALEYIHGRDLDKVVRRHVEVYGRSLSVPVAFYIMQEVLEALAYAHTRLDQNGQRAEIVHRDVAPGNVLLSFRGEVKLSDFGIAKADGRVSKTELGTLKGNACFMSPEQARGEAVDGRSDVFSAGAVLYYCLTAQFLYSDDEAMFKRLLRAAAGPALAEFSQIDQIPPLAANAIRRAVSPNREDRYQSAQEFERDLIGHYTGGRSELADLMNELFPQEHREPQ